MRLIIPGKDVRGDLELRAVLCQEMVASPRGAIDFARYMELCLQHPAHGYYRRGRSRAGHGGDFLTSPEAHPAFAGCVARQLAALAAVLGERNPVWVEAGAGSGTMANLLAADVPEATIVALDSAGHGHRRAAEGPQPLRVQAASLPFAGITGIVANELLDAFPVHRLRRVGEGWRELAVGLAGEQFVWKEVEPCEEALAEATRAMARGAKVPEGAILDLNPGIGPWLAQAARAISRGFVLLADYGHDTPRLYEGTRVEGTLRCFAGHALHHDPFLYPGTQDMTASVDFGAVAEHAAAAGFEIAAFLDQRAWLDGWGVGEAAERLHTRVEEGGIRLDEAELNAGALEFLRDPAGLGAVRIICFAKGLARQPLPGLTHPADRPFGNDLPLTRLFDPFADLMQ